MYTTSYNKELKTAQAEIIRLFSNITIPLRRGGKTIKSIVPCVFGQTSRILKSILNPSAAPQIYPIIVVERGEIQIDLQRNSELQHDIAIMTSSTSYDPDTKPPTPVIMDFTVNVFSKYPEELDMVVTNFIPFFNKDVFVITPHPKLEGKNLRHQIIWLGNVSFEWKSSLQNTEQDIQMATFKLQYKTEIFGGVDKLTDGHEGDIYTINMSLSPSTGEIYPDFDSDNPDGNLLGGFYAVPYSMSFSTFADAIINRYLDNDIDYDGLVSNAFNARFNTGVMNKDIDYMEDAVENGANIYKRSYWPFKYALTNCGTANELTKDELLYALSSDGKSVLKDNGIEPKGEDGEYTVEQVKENTELLTDYGNFQYKVVKWLIEHDALIPSGEHYVSEEEKDYTLSDYGRKVLLVNGVYPEDAGNYTKKQIDSYRFLLTEDRCFKYVQKINYSETASK